MYQLPDGSDGTHSGKNRIDKNSVKDMLWVLVPSMNLSNIKINRIGQKKDGECLIVLVNLVSKEQVMTV